MNFPSDTPTWLERIFTDLEDRMESAVTTADTADKALKSAGAFGLWVTLKNEVELAYQNEQRQRRERSKELNARVIAG